MSVQMMMAGIAAAAMTMSAAGVGAGAKLAVQGDMAQSAPVKRASSRTKYCVMMTSTGTRLERKVCRTRSEWLAEGFDPHSES